MKRILKTVSSLALAASLVVAAAGCQTYGEGVGAGAGLGALTGAIIGNQSGNAMEGALIGGVIGGAAGAIAHDIKVRRARSREETAAAYNYQPQRGLELHRETYEPGEVLPSVAAPGAEIQATIQYALLGAYEGVEIVETRTLMQGDRLIADLSSKSVQRSDGTWVSTLPFRLPDDLAPGQYRVVQTVRVPSRSGQSISSSGNFTVAYNR